MPKGKRVVKTVRRVLASIKNSSSSPKKKQKRRPRKQGMRDSSVSKAPVAIGNRNIMRGPSRNRVFEVSNREYVGTMFATGSFSNTPYIINPGLIASFPWLATVAQNFEYYRFKKLVYEYKTVCTTTTVGTIILVGNYDVADALFTTRQMALDYAGAVSFAPWLNGSVSLKPPLMNYMGMHYVRTTTTTPSLTDRRLYDVGAFQFISDGTSGGSALGDLYVSYTIDLINPKIPGVVGEAASSFELTNNGPSTPSTIFSGANLQAVGVQIASLLSGNQVAFTHPGTYMYGLSTNQAVATGVGATLSGPGTSTHYATGSTTVTNLLWGVVTGIVASSVLTFAHLSSGATSNVVCTIAEVSSLLASPRPLLTLNSTDSNNLPLPPEEEKKAVSDEEALSERDLAAFKRLLVLSGGSL